MKEEYLSPDERAEYDALLADAGLDDNGQPHPSKEIGPRVHQRLLALAQTGSTWAKWILLDDAEAGHLKRFNDWLKARNKQRVITESGDVVPKPAVVGVRRRHDDGTTFYQQSFWRDVTWAEVEQKLAEATATINAARITSYQARRLLRLRDRVPESTGPAAACLLLGIEVTAYIAGEQDLPAA